MDKNEYKSNIRVNKELFDFFTDIWQNRSVYIRFLIITTTAKISYLSISDLKKILQEFKKYDKQYKKDKIISFRYDQNIKRYMHYGLFKTDFSFSKYIRFCMWFLLRR